MGLDLIGRREGAVNGKKRGKAFMARGRNSSSRIHCSRLPRPGEERRQVLGEKGKTRCLTREKKRREPQIKSAGVRGNPGEKKYHETNQEKGRLMPIPQKLNGNPRREVPPPYQDFLPLNEEEGDFA